jgi:hypothetical protein
MVIFEMEVEFERISLLDTRKDANVRRFEMLDYAHIDWDDMRLSLLSRCYQPRCLDHRCAGW